MSGSNPRTDNLLTGISAPKNTKTFLFQTPQNCAEYKTAETKEYPSVFRFKFSRGDKLVTTIILFIYFIWNLELQYLRNMELFLISF